MRTKTKVLVVGVVTAFVAGASGVAVAASSSAGKGTSPSAIGTAKAGRTASRGQVENFFDAKAVALLAARLRLPLDQARTMAARLERLAAQGGIDPTGAEFGSIAKDAGTTPQKLAAALDQVKRAKG
jgi:hypothetical protein